MTNRIITTSASRQFDSSSIPDKSNDRRNHTAVILPLANSEARRTVQARYIEMAQKAVVECENRQWI